MKCILASKEKMKDLIRVVMDFLKEQCVDNTPSLIL